MAPRTDPWRVLWLAKGLGRGGAERLIVDAAGMLDRGRFDVEVAYLLPWKDALVGELAEADVPVHCLGQRSAYDMRWAVRLRRLVAERGYDLVHTHAPVPAVAARVGLAGPRPRLVHTEHNVWSRYRRLTYWSNAVTYARNDHVVAVSEAVADSIPDRQVRRHGLRAPVEVVVHGIRLSSGERPPTAQARRQARDTLHLPEDAPVVGTVGNLTAKKDQATLLRAFARVLDCRADARLVVIGAGVLEMTLKREATDLGVDHAILWAGSRPDVPALLPAFDVFTLTSRFEGLPISMLEAMAAGLPMVVTPVGGIGEVITEGREGLFAPVGDPAAVSERLVRLLTDPALRAKMGSAARIRSLDFDLSPAVRRIEEIYDEVLGS